MIVLENINRTFVVGDQPVHALAGISLTMEAGEYVSIMGPSGSGKSTLLNILGLLDRPDTGIYLLDGQNVTALGDQDEARFRREKIGFVFQSFHLVPRLTAFQNIELPLILAGISAAERKERVAQAAAAVGLSDRVHHRPDQLSGGQRQRVAIARATIMRPTLLLADEPTGNLDRQSGQEIINLLETLNAQAISLVVVTHDPELGNRAQRKIKMTDGRITEDHSGNT